MTKNQLVRHLNRLDDLVTEAAIYTTAAQKKIPEPTRVCLQTVGLGHLRDVADRLRDAQELVDELQKEVRNG